MPDLPVQLLTECHADTALIRLLFPDHKMSIHEQGCPEVAKAMLSPRAGEYKLIGIVDNDKKLNIHCKGFFATFEEIHQGNSLYVRHRPETNQHLIVIDKAIESFIQWNAIKVNLKISEYGFQDLTIKRFGLQLKTPTIETDPNFLQLLADLYDRQAPGFVTLKQILDDFINP